jgi:hypothetical protein
VLELENRMQVVPVLSYTIKRNHEARATYTSAIVELLVDTKKHKDLLMRV